MLYLFQIPAYLWFFLIVALISFLLWSKFYFSDENQTKIILNKVKKYFGFLFDYGFKIDSDDTNGPNGAWAIILKSEKCKIRITQDRGDIYCELAPTKADESKYLHLFSIIANIENKQAKLYHPQSGGSNYQLEFYSKLLKLHYEEVIDFMKNPSNFFQSPTNKN